MDLTPYYEAFEKTCKTANFAVVLAFIVIAFLCYRTVKDNSEDCNKKWQKTLYIIGYCVILLSVLFYYFAGPVQIKKDIEQQTICSHDGIFEIVEVKRGGETGEVIIVTEGKELHLKFEIYSDGFDSKRIQEGMYHGSIVYAQHHPFLLYIEIQEEIEKDSS